MRDVLENYEWRHRATSPPDWDFEEAAVFALGGLASVSYDHPERPGRAFLGRPPWYEEVVLDTLDVHYVESDGEDWESAWDSVADRLDASEPVLLFLDPGDLRYLDADHPYPHAAVAIGYGDGMVLIADPVDGTREVSRGDLRRAWDVPEPFGAKNRYVAVATPEIGVDRETAASRSLRRTTGYMLDSPESNDRVWGERGEHGLAGLRAFADDVARWPDREMDLAAAAADAHRSLTRGKGAAYRRLYAEGLEDVAPAAGLPGTVADRMHDLADEWEGAAEKFAAAREADSRPVRVAEIEDASGSLGAIAQAERDFFRGLRRDLE